MGFMHSGLRVGIEIRSNALVDFCYSKGFIFSLSSFLKSLGGSRASQLCALFGGDFHLVLTNSIEELNTYTATEHFLTHN